jgi:hypothetical protein
MKIKFFNPRLSSPVRHYSDSLLLCSFLSSSKLCYYHIPPGYGYAGRIGFQWQENYYYGSQGKYANVGWTSNCANPQAMNLGQFGELQNIGLSFLRRVEQSINHSPL